MSAVCIFQPMSSLSKTSRPERWHERNRKVRISTRLFFLWCVLRHHIYMYMSTVYPHDVHMVVGALYCVVAMSVLVDVHWNGNVFILMKFSSLAALKVVKMTTSSAASDENFVKMTTFSFQCMWSTLSHVLQGCFTGTGGMYHCLIASEVNLKDMSKIGLYETATNGNKVWTACIFLGIYCYLAQIARYLVKTRYSSASGVHPWAGSCEKDTRFGGIFHSFIMKP